MAQLLLEDKLNFLAPMEMLLYCLYRWPGIAAILFSGENMRLADMIEVRRSARSFVQEFGWFTPIISMKRAKKFSADQGCPSFSSSFPRRRDPIRPLHAG
jgi:hypothetical protein